MLRKLGLVRFPSLCVHLLSIEWIGHIFISFFEYYEFSIGYRFRQISSRFFRLLSSCFFFFVRIIFNKTFSPHKKKYIRETPLNITPIFHHHKCLSNRWFMVPSKPAFKFPINPHQIIPIMEHFAERKKTERTKWMNKYCNVPM